MTRPPVRPPRPRKLPKIAVWKFSSCDGCQMSLLDCEDELLALAGQAQLAYFPEATRAEVRGPYDLSLVEGSITTPHEVERIHEVRRLSRQVLAIGACATAGGIQALRNFVPKDDLVRMVYASPEYVETLATSTAIADHVQVDYELRGCPVNKKQLLLAVQAMLAGRTPTLPTFSVCLECKRRGNVCVTVARGQPCLGPITQAGCGALCPSWARGCFGCFGPSESINLEQLKGVLRGCGLSDAEVLRELRRFNAGAKALEGGRP
ncbi:MAG TPA: oxidoreductase [Anaeromyxobacteraceae bacterium]|nr:oxidoreductase [Anaeromyxobacteraceae bacterium]